MVESILDLEGLLGSLEPHLHEGVYVYSSVPFGTDLTTLDVIGTFREKEGLSIILLEAEALMHRLPILFRAAWITLTVTSDLNAVGLTAAFSTALANAGIGCNVIAGAHHDHIFVPVERGDEAIEVLRRLNVDE
jgi:hypothetical protein